jgi:hypothetical protein
MSPASSYASPGAGRGLAGADAGWVPASGRRTYFQLPTAVAGFAFDFRGYF